MKNPGVSYGDRDPPPPGPLHRLAAIGQSRAMTACMRATLPMLYFAPFITIVVSSTALTASSTTGVFAFTCVSAALQILSFSRAHSFVLGTFHADMPLLTILPYSYWLVLNCFGLYYEQLPPGCYIFHDLLMKPPSHRPKEVATMCLSAFVFLVAIYHLINSLRARAHTRAALVAAGYDVSNYDKSWAFVPYELLPFATTKSGSVKVIKGVTYKSSAVGAAGVAPILTDDVVDGQLNLKADVWVSNVTNDDSPKPVLLYVHGGAWILGARDLGVIVPLLHRAAVEGWVAISVDYRLCPASAWPDFLVDVKSAIAWIRSGDAEAALGVRLDASKIVLAGDSAGGHIVGLTALTTNMPKYQPGFEDVDTSVSGVIDMFGPGDVRKRKETKGAFEQLVIQKSMADAPELFDEASPAHHINEAMLSGLRWFNFTGTRDGLVPIEVNRLYYRELFRTIGVDNVSISTGASKVVRVELIGSFHGFCAFYTIKTKAFIDAVAEMLRDVAISSSLPSSSNNRI